MPTPSKNGTASKLSEQNDSIGNQSNLFVDGKLDAEAYFRFLDEYWKLFQKKTPREPIVIKVCKF